MFLVPLPLPEIFCELLKPLMNISSRRWHSMPVDDNELESKEGVHDSFLDPLLNFVHNLDLLFSGCAANGAVLMLARRFGPEVAWEFVICREAT